MKILTQHTTCSDWYTLSRKGEHSVLHQYQITVLRRTLFAPTNLPTADRVSALRENDMVKIKPLSGFSERGFCTCCFYGIMVRPLKLGAAAMSLHDGIGRARSSDCAPSARRGVCEIVMRLGQAVSTGSDGCAPGQRLPYHGGLLRGIGR